MDNLKLKAYKLYNSIPTLKRLDPEIKPIKEQMDKTFGNIIDLSIDIDPNTNNEFNIFEALERYKHIGTDLKIIDNELNNISDVNNKYPGIIEQQYYLNKMFELIIKMFEIHIGMFEREFKIKIELIKEF